MEPQPGRHLNTIDTLRGIASLSVCLFHYTGAVLPKVHVPMLATIFGWGWAGVEIFFVISGFIIPYVLFTYNNSIKGFWKFIGKRLVRVGPPSYVAIILILIQWWFFDYVFHTHHTYLTNVSWQQVLSNLTYTAPFTNHEWFNGVFWTLSVEFQFYILMGLAFSFSFKNIYSFIGFSTIVIAIFYVEIFIPIHSKELLGSLFFNSGIFFLMGGLAMMHRVKRVTLPSYLVILTVFAVVCYLQHSPLVTFIGTVSALAISFIEIKNKAGAFLGKISYSLYLVHILCAPIFEMLFIKIIPISNTAGKVMVQTLCLFMSILCAYIFYLIIEKYFINLSNKLFSNEPKAGTPMPVVKS